MDHPLVPPLCLLAVALVLHAPAASAAMVPPVSSAFGSPGGPLFTAYPIPEELPNAHNAGEPTIGIPWTTDHVFFQAFASTHKAVFDDGTAPATVQWSDVSPAFTPVNIDPMVHADATTGRIYAGGLAGPCSLMAISDNDAQAWTPAANMCSGAQFDHQSIGSGAWAPSSDGTLRTALYPRATYYCAQAALTACATSLDGGRVWLPPVEVMGPCGGLHGHIAVSEVTGTAAVPHGSCAAPESSLAIADGAFVGFAYTTDNGLTWSSRTMPASRDGEGFDPDLAFSQGSGWLWLAQADALGIHVALSKNEGLHWEVLGAATAASQPGEWYDLAPTFQDSRTGQNLVFGAFANLEAGDDNRIALSYLATTDPTARDPFTDCSPDSDGNIWHYYLSRSMDGGRSWETTRLSEDPVQVGAIWSGGFGSGRCRNLLDFNDMDMDSQGRLHIAFADGCTGACSDKYSAWANSTGEPPVGADSRDARGTILRQTTGLGLLASHDKPPFDQASNAATTSTSKQSPGLSVLTLLGLLFAGAIPRQPSDISKEARTPSQRDRRKADMPAQEW